MPIDLFRASQNFVPYTPTPEEQRRNQLAELKTVDFLRGAQAQNELGQMLAAGASPEDLARRAADLGRFEQAKTLLAWGEEKKDKERDEKLAEQERADAASKEFHELFEDAGRQTKTSWNVYRSRLGRLVSRFGGEQLMTQVPTEYDPEWIKAQKEGYKTTTTRKDLSNPGTIIQEDETGKLFATKTGKAEEWIRMTPEQMVEADLDDGVWYRKYGVGKPERVDTVAGGSAANTPARQAQEVIALHADNGIDLSLEEAMTIVTQAKQKPLHEYVAAYVDDMLPKYLEAGFQVTPADLEALAEAQWEKSNTRGRPSNNVMGVMAYAGAEGISMSQEEAEALAAGGVVERGSQLLRWNPLTRTIVVVEKPAPAPPPSVYMNDGRQNIPPGIDPDAPMMPSQHMNAPVAPPVAAGAYPPVMSRPHGGVGGGDPTRTLRELEAWRADVKAKEAARQNVLRQLMVQ